MPESLATPDTPSGPALLAGYRKDGTAFDEMLSEDGSLRNHYAGLMRGLESFSPNELQHRWDSGRRLVSEQGIAYNVYGDPRGMERPWQLDPVPLVLSPSEWSALETALTQRAALLNRILVDCYGAQELIRSRWLSPALVFAQPDFLRPCHGIRTPGDTYLHFYAADLARSPDGQWWVMSDRTQIPTGAGYALANRLVTSRILPELFRDNNVLRLAGFFRAMQQSLLRLSPRNGENARIVILTAGPHNETYFEQAYLARYLGYTLVEGQDLTVRDDHVFLKTLSGLEPVDVIFRRVDDDFCDPLELRSDSMLGVPGLVEALRTGNVAVANALGSGLVQSPAFMAFLPGLCKHLFGEELKLPSVATWWCGQKSAREYALEHIDELVIRPAFRTRAFPFEPDKPSAAAGKATLRRHIEFDPDLFVAQERVDGSAAPTWEDGGLVSRPVHLRAFVVATANGYHVMPGGLARVAPDGSGRFASMQRGSSSKDVWVPSDKPVEEVTLLDPSTQHMELHRTGNNLTSRLADNFFWLGRYSERADATARLLRSALRRFNPERTGSAMPLLAPLLRTMERQGQLSGISAKPELRQNPEAFEAELLAAVFDPSRSGSLRQSSEQLQRLAILVRGRTSDDMWRVLTRINERLATPTNDFVMLAGDAMEVLTATLLGLAAFQGLARENMTRAQAWRFLDMGLRIERSVYLATLMEATLVSPEAENPSVLEAVLEVADSSITFRTRYNLFPHAPAVFDLILCDDKNPRSVLFQLNQLSQHFEHLPRERLETSGAGGAILKECLDALNHTDARELAGPRQTWADGAVMRALRQVLRELPRISDAIAASFFAHSTVSRTGWNDNP